MIKYLKKITILMLLTICNFICYCNYNNDVLLIKGNLKNLPDGIISIVDISQHKLSSSKTKNGIFELSVKIDDKYEPLIVRLEHTDFSNVKRLFGYKTTELLNGKIHFTNSFILENGIEMNSEIEEFKSLNSRLKMMTLKKDIFTGKQNQAYLSNFFLRKENFILLKNAIEKFPSSFYLMYELEKNLYSFDNTQSLSLLNEFDKNVKNSETGNRVRNFIKNKDRKKLNFETVTLDVNGKNQKILNQESNLNMIILWASWCGPCRKEIPELKNIFKEYSNDTLFNMLSLSMDEEPDNWKKALRQEKMPWKQLLISKDLSIHSKEFFSFNGSIPTVLFVDKKGVIVKKIVGYDKNNSVEFRKIINQYISLK